MKKYKVLAVVLVAVLLLVAAFSFYGSYLSYNEVGATSVYFTNLWAKAMLYVVTFLLAGVVMYLQALAVKKTVQYIHIEPKFMGKKLPVKTITLIITVLTAFFIGELNYEKVLLFLNKQSFGVADPLYGLDVSFFVFSRPFYEMLSGVLGAIVIIGTIFAACLYLLYFAEIGISHIKYEKKVITHIGIGIVAFFMIKSVQVFLSGSGMVLSMFGANISGTGFVGDHIWRIFYTVGPFVLVASAVVTLVFLVKWKVRPLIVSAGVFPALFIVFFLVSALVQAVYVAPREVTAEAPYIKNNIEYTKIAYDIDDIEERMFNVSYNLTKNDIKNNEDTVNNIRITDNNANLTVANTLQATRGYYSFVDMDILPYEINGKTVGLATAVRELDKSKLDNTSKNYINTRLRYTHGYGVVMSTINTVTTEGQPEYIVKDVPLNIADAAPVINRPQVYYGELTDDYVVVGTDYQELDYMAEGQSVETRYNGEGGVKLSPINRLYYTIAESDLMMLFSGYINSDSKILINRNIIDRAKLVAPYLMYDPDPYMVVDDAGNLKWIIDAYTITDKYPYAQKYYDINYIRNSVKVVVDAYDGTMDFYVTDKNDPIIGAYSKIYPGVFKDEALPDGIKEHIRYPEFLFKIQMQMYQAYHVSDPETFYSKSDLWLTAKERHNNTEERDVEPYYNVMRLTGDASDDMVLMLPFIPNAKQNLIAWVGASSNYETYGDMVVYKFPEGSPVYGTLQIENRIAADPYISQQISLWDQGGSEVILGNLLVVPIENSILYIEPLYITSGGESGIPQVKRIIVAYNDLVVMEDSLYSAIAKILGATDEELGIIEDIVDSTEQGTSGTPLVGADLTKIKEVYKSIKDALATNDWDAFAQRMSELDSLLGE